MRQRFYYLKDADNPALLMYENIDKTVDRLCAAKWILMHSFGNRLVRLEQDYPLELPARASSPPFDLPQTNFTLQLDYPETTI